MIEVERDGILKRAEPHLVVISRVEERDRSAFIEPAFQLLRGEFRRRASLRFDSRHSEGDNLTLDLDQHAIEGLLVADAEGMSVLTAWAAGKFDAERIGKAVKGSGVTDKLNHKKLVIPGHVAILLGEIEEELPGWKILVGPREAVDIPCYVKVWQTL